MRVVPKQRQNSTSPTKTVSFFSSSRKVRLLRFSFGLPKWVMTSAWTVVVISLFVGAYLWSADWILSKGFAFFFLKTR